jgi:hypothetical protein
MVWGALVNITTAGAGTFTATNSFNNRTVLDAGDTISPPSGSGGGGGRIIGG